MNHIQGFIVLTDAAEGIRVGIPISNIRIFYGYENLTAMKLYDESIDNPPHMFRENVHTVMSLIERAYTK